MKLSLLFFLLPLLFFSCNRIPKGDLTAKIEKFAPVKGVEADPYFREGSWPTEDWWELFEDDILSCLISTAFANSPTLKGAEAKVREMLQIARENYALLLPELDFRGFLDYQHLSKDSLVRFPPAQVPAVINQIDLTLNFRYELDFWGKNRKTFKAALSKAKSQALDAAQVRILLGVSVARAYFDLVYQMEKKLIVQKQLVRKKKLLELTQARYTNNIDDRINVSVSSEDLMEMEKRLFQAENGIALSQHLLGVLIGLGPDQDFEVEIKTPQKRGTFPLPKSLPIALLSRRADLMARLWSAESAAYDIGVAKTLFYPNIDLTAMGGLNSLSFSKLFTVGSMQGSLKPAITLPLYTGGKLRSNLRAKANKFDALVNQYNELILQASGEVADGISSLMQLTKETQTQIGIMEQMRVQYALAKARYEDGIDNMLYLLDVEESVLTQKLITADLDYGKRLAIIALIKALGGGYEPGDDSDLGEYKKYG